MSFINTLKTNIEAQGGSWSDFEVDWKDELTTLENGGTLSTFKQTEFDAGIAIEMPDATPTEISDLQAQIVAETTNVDTSDKFIVHLGGQFLLDPNEVNGYGPTGPTDDTVSQDLGNADAANLSRVTGGFTFPFDVKVTRFFANHYNNNAAAEAWGWVVGKQVKTGGSNTVTTTFIKHEAQENGDVGPRNYLSTTNQVTDLDLSAITENVVPAGDTLFVGVASPTANTTNYYVRIFSGYIELERVNN